VTFPAGRTVPRLDPYIAMALVQGETGEFRDDDGGDFA
jgi:hypothetical protein